LLALHQQHAQYQQQQQQMPQLQSELHQLHEQFARAPDDAALPAALFSDNLGCDDIVPPPPGFASNVGLAAAAGVRAAGVAPGALQAVMMSAAAAGHNSAGILSELESIKGPAMVSRQLATAVCARALQHPQCMLVCSSTCMIDYFSSRNTSVQRQMSRTQYSGLCQLLLLLLLLYCALFRPGCWTRTLPTSSSASACQRCWTLGHLHLQQRGGCHR
jgi:hypothetical protein